MIIDSHGHYTTVPAEVLAFRARQIGLMGTPARGSVKISDDVVRESVSLQLKQQKERGSDLTLFSPQASGMGHHFGDARISRYWSEVCNDAIAHVCRLFPQNFVGVCQLPQSPGVSLASCVEEL